MLTRGHFGISAHMAAWVAAGRSSRYRQHRPTLDFVHNDVTTEVFSSSSERPTVRRLVLGTAQFESSYGIARDKSEASVPLEPKLMLAEASAVGISSLDTAPGYGSAEQIIGDYGWRGEIATKVDKHSSPRESLHQSLRRLKRDIVDVVYVHDYQQLASESFVSEFVSLRGDGARSLGASVYELDEFEDAMSRDIFDVLQFPLSVFDRRFLPIAATASARGIRLVARSAMLQGLLSRNGLAMAKPSQPLQPLLRDFEEVCDRFTCEPQVAAVSWVLCQPFIDQIIIGFDSVSQLRQIVQQCAETSMSTNAVALLDDLPQPSRDLVDPRTWR